MTLTRPHLLAGAAGPTAAGLLADALGVTPVGFGQRDDKVILLRCSTTLSRPAGLGPSG